MLLDQALVAEDGDAGDGVHVLRVQEVDELRDIVNVDLVLAQQRVLEGDGYAAVTVFDIEDNRVAADFAPVADDAQSVVAGGHDAGQVNGADFKIFGYRDRLFDDGGGENSGDYEVFVGFQDVAGAAAVDLANVLSQFGRGQVGSPAHVSAGDGGDGFSSLRGVDFSAGCCSGSQEANVGRLGARRYCRAYRFYLWDLSHGDGWCGNRLCCL